MENHAIRTPGGVPRRPASPSAWGALAQDAGPDVDGHAGPERGAGRLNPDPAPRHFAILMRLAGWIDHAAAAGAWGRLVAEQPALRSAPGTDEDGYPTLRPLPAADWPQLQCIRVTAHADAVATHALSLPEVAGFAQTDPSSGPTAPTRAAWIQSGDGQPFLLVLVHDALCDGHGVALLPRLMEAALLDRSLPPAQAPQRLSAARGGPAPADAQLAVPQEEAPLHRDGTGSRLRESRTLTLPLDLELWQSLDALARAEALPPVALGWTAFALLLERLAGGPVPLCLPTQRRRTRKEHGTIAHGVALVRLMTDASAAPSFVAAVRTARQRMVAAARQGTEDVLEPGASAFVFEMADQDLHLERLLPGLAVGEAVLSWESLPARVEAWELKLVMRPPRAGTGGEVRLTFDPGSFTEARAGSLLAAYRHLLAAAIADPLAPPASLPVAAGREVAPTWPAQPLPRPHGLEGAPASLAEVFAAALAGQPDAPAVVWRGGSASFAQLDLLAQRLAALLIARGARQGEIVAFRLDAKATAADRALFLAAQVACLRLGAALLPLGQQQPAEQARSLIEMLGVRFVFGATSPLDCAPAGAMTARQDPIAGYEAALLVSCAGGVSAGPRLPAGTAIVLTTSGTTGQPKAICLTHAMLLGLLRGVAGSGTVPPRSFLMGANIAFDMALADVWLSWVYRRPVVVLGTERRTPAALAEARDLGAEVLSLSPTVAAAALRAAPGCFNGFKCLMLVGEALPRALARRLAEQAPDLAVVNGYGPSEMAIFTTLAQVEGMAEGTVPIGRVLPGYRVLIADPRTLAPLPPHWPGELLIASAAPAVGYVDPDMTAARLIAVPGEPGGPFFRSGDLGWTDAAGEIRFIGRGDRQAKVAGVRIELDGVEHVISRVPGVADVAAVVQAVGDRAAQVVAVVQPASARQDLPALQAAILAECRAALLRAAIPARIVFVDAMPTGGSGKKSHSALLAMLDQHAALAGPGTARSLPAPGSIAGRLAALWQALFAANGIACGPLHLDDDVFALGATSLDAISMVEQIERSFDVRWPDDRIFTHPTIAAQAAALSGRDKRAPGTQLPTGPRVLRRAAGPDPSKGIVLGMPQLDGSVVVPGIIAKIAFTDLDVLACPARPGNKRGSGPYWVAAAQAIARLVLDGQIPPPRVLVGFSLGGWLAWAVDRLLVHAGRPPTPIVNLDGGPLQALRPEWGESLARLLPEAGRLAPERMLLLHRAGSLRSWGDSDLGESWLGAGVAVEQVKIRTTRHGDVASPEVITAARPILEDFVAGRTVTDHTSVPPAGFAVATAGGRLFEMIDAAEPPTPGAISAILAGLPPRAVEPDLRGALLFLALCSGDADLALRLARRLATEAPQFRPASYAEVALLAELGRKGEAQRRAEAWLATGRPDGPLKARARRAAMAPAAWQASEGLVVHRDRALDLATRIAAHGVARG